MMGLVFKWLFDRTVSFIGLLVLWPILIIVAVLIKVKVGLAHPDNRENLAQLYVTISDKKTISKLLDIAAISRTLYV